MYEPIRYVMWEITLIYDCVEHLGNTGEEGQVNVLVFLELCGKVWHLRMCYGKLTREEPFFLKHGNTVLKRQCIEV